MKQIIFGALVPLTLLLLFGCTAPQSAQSTLQSTEDPAAEHVISSEPATVQKLQIVSQPTKTDYQSGELFDPTGLVINAIMSDGTVRENVSYTVENAETPLKGRMTSVSVLCEDMLLRIPVTIAITGNLDQYSVAQTETIESSPV
ncbi:MAG: bacterial Ig-like domain-containing protein, partial [Clostridia bacterium]|nr:bacterial Ig-like domain-containing protein [Clostridia bacterium]